LRPERPAPFLGRIVDHAESARIRIPAVGQPFGRFDSFRAADDPQASSALAARDESPQFQRNVSKPEKGFVAARIRIRFLKPPDLFRG
jgi:hypothetical protein